MPWLRRSRLHCFLVFCATLLSAAAAEENLASRVLVVANSDDPDSLRIARHYAERREVPAANVIALPMPRTESVSWREFVGTVWQPLLDRLVADRWVDAIAMSATDAIGRRKYAPYSHRIAALVLCRGVPLKIAHDPALFTEVPPLTSRSEFRTNAGSVDSELSLLPLTNYLINAFQRNPLFQNDRPSANAHQQVVKVARLDGPDVDDALHLVDRAIAAERTGLLGRAYIDLAQDPVGNNWLRSAASQLTELGFDTAIHEETETFPPTARFDAPVLYFGWYIDHANGPFMLPGFRFPPGAIALHIHSFSASTLRSRDNGWTGPFVARGVTATVGNVHEPYLQLTHRPDLFVRALARGQTLAEAAYYALPALSWQAILVGDPLFRPFAVSLEQQLKNRATLPASQAAYVVLRQMRHLDATKRSAEATAFAIAAQREAPSLAVGVELAQRLQRGGDHEAAGSALGFAAQMKSFEATDWALAREAAELLLAGGRSAAALGVWRTLLGSALLPRDVRVAWLPDALKAAHAAKETGQEQTWQSQLAELTAAAAKK